MRKLTSSFLAFVVALLVGTPALAAETAKAARVDINTATEAQLRAVPGVGEAYARKIVEARPYYAKEELKTKGVLSAEEFEKIKKLLDSVC